MGSVVAVIFVVVTVAATPARAAPPSVEVFAGAVGGVPTGHDVPGTCSTYGPIEPEAKFFPSSVTFGSPQGGIAFCGYSGDTSDLVAALGPIVTSQAVGPVLLGNAGFAGSYMGTAEAVADFKVLKAGARGMITPPGSGSPVSLNYASGAAIFDDVLTATSPLVTIPSAGYVRYTFSFEGSLSAVGTAPAGSIIQSIASATLHIEHDDGPNYEIVRVDAMRGSMGTLHAPDGTMGTFVAGPDTISGGGTFTSTIVGQFANIDQSFTWGKPFRLKAGLMATAIGDCMAEFSSTARLVKVDFYDAAHMPVGSVTITSASGTDYGEAPATVPDGGPVDALPASDAGVDPDAGPGLPDAPAVDLPATDPSVGAGSGGGGGCSCVAADGDGAGPAFGSLVAVAAASCVLIPSRRRRRRFS
jgi:hypothetical protein